MTIAGLIVRPATEADYPAIAAVLDRAFSPIPLEQRLRLWRWRYDANPAKTESIPPIMVGERGGKIVGVHGLVPLRVKVGDTVLVASCGCDLAVESSARSAGMLIKAKAMSKELSPLHLATSANVVTNKITLALGGKELRLGRRILVKPLRISGVVRRRIAAAGGAIARATAASAGAILGKPLDWALAIARKVHSYPRMAAAKIEEISQFDQRFDRFWESVSRDAKIMHVRDADYLNWRYAQYPFSGIQSFALVHQSRILGLAVIHQTTDADGLRSAAILELLVLRDEIDAFDLLLVEAIRRAAKAGADLMTARTSTAKWHERYRNCGFRLRRLAHSPLTYKNNSEIRDEVFADDDNWYVSLGDGDYCYYYE